LRLKAKQQFGSLAWAASQITLPAHYIDLFVITALTVAMR